MLTTFNFQINEQNKKNGKIKDRFFCGQNIDPYLKRELKPLA